MNYRIPVLALLVVAGAACTKPRGEAGGGGDAGAAPNANSDAREAQCEGAGDSAAVTCNDLGNAYADGENGHERNAGKAVTFYQKSCDKGFRLGCRNLGLVYESGAGVPMNRLKAIELLDRACQAGLGLGCDDLGDLYDQGKAGGTIDQTKGFIAFQHGCDLGAGSSCAKLGRHYKDGAGVAKDVPKGISLYEKGCESYRLACDDLGDVYAKGMGVPVDKAKAKTYYTKACTAGFDLGCTHAKELK